MQQRHVRLSDTEILELASPATVIFADEDTLDVLNEEGATSDTYTVVLNEDPGDGATVTVTVNPDAQISINTSGSGVSVPFDFTGGPSGTWDDPQTVQVYPVDDGDSEDSEDSPHNANITHSITGSGTPFDGVNIVDVTVQVLDNDSDGVFASATSVAVTENGVTGSYTVALLTNPTDTVTVDLDPNDSEINLGAGAGVTKQLTFTSDPSGTWDEPQTVTITAVDDNAVEVVHVTQIDYSASSTDSDYDSGLDLSGLQMTVAVTDDDLPPSGLSAHWAFDEPTGSTTAADYSIFGSTGALTGAEADVPEFVAGGMRDNALVFEGGNSERVIVADDNALDFGDGNGTIMFWMYVESLASETDPDILRKGLKTGPNYKIDLNHTLEGNQQIRVALKGSGLKTPTYNHTGELTGSWHHVALVRDVTASKELTLYLNGVFAKEASGNGQDVSNSGVLNIGADAQASLDDFFDGKLDDLRFYKWALPLDEILDHLNGVDTGMVAHWRFDEFNRNTAYDYAENENAKGFALP